MITILDFGSQYTHLICRRIRDMGVRCEILPYSESAKLKKCPPSGIILSGSPRSVLEKDPPLPDPSVFSLGVPVLGICYGMQAMAAMLGGELSAGGSSEYGEAYLYLDREGGLFGGFPGRTRIWISHRDSVSTAPPGFKTDGHTRDLAAAAISDRKRDLYGIQFHPEVAHTPRGSALLENFVCGICGAEKDWDLGKWMETESSRIKREVGRGRVIMALSGGVDSSVAGVFIKRALGDRFFPVYVDHGLARAGDRARIEDILNGKEGLDVRIVDASDRFLSALKGVAEPEEKRRIIGKEFADVFLEEAAALEGITHFAQGTLYPDVIESARAGTGSTVIKTHHNVGGLPSYMDLELLEPFRALYKDEVREIGRQLGIDRRLIDQHPFPGPGLAIRIAGSVSGRKLDILRKADLIMEEELVKANIYYSLWQAFPVFLPVRSVGVMGDERTYENVICLRCVESRDAMTANWAEVPYGVLGEISRRIVNEVRGINRVLYDITNKPPSTIEWE